METRSETDYVCHHLQKVVGFFMAMRLFAEKLRGEGHNVRYFRLDDADNRQSFAANCAALIAAHGIQHFEYQEPDEWRVSEHLKTFATGLGLPHRCVSTEHFYTERDTLKRLFEGKKIYLMESFYRKMREKHNVLMEMDGKTPLTGRWNYDAENRKKMPAKQSIPPSPTFFRDASAVVQTIRDAGVRTMGQLDEERFNWPLTRAESLDLLEHFVAFRLRFFGDFQDALTTRDWVLFHSRLSFSLNIKLISPQEVVNRCVAYWQSHPDLIPFAALEGFVRQILGWREYMRGIYWAEMPQYRERNFFGHDAPLPEWFWTGETRMRCLRHAIGQSLEHAYAHHIQRLMVTGNFALLLGAAPDAVDEWYLGIYMDALEWVEITNTRGMSQFADGGIVGTKPYVSSANYLHKMGDYCDACPYDRTARHGEKACPFNALYWDFYARNAPLLRGNPRIGMAYQVWDKMPADEQTRILERADFIKKHVNTL